MRPGTRDSYLDAIQRVITHVATHLDDAIDLEMLAAGACLSPFHFHRVFRGMVGETPMEFVRRLRLERAAWQLAHSTAPVTTVAFDAGYEAHEAFTRAFRQHFGASPTEFRATPRVHHHLATPCGVHFDPRGGVAPFVPRSTGGSTMHVDIETQPARRLATVRHLGPYNQIGRAFAELGQRLGPAMGMLFAQGGAMIALYHDAPESVAPDELRSDAGVVVPEDFALTSAVSEQRLPAAATRRPCTWARTTSSATYGSASLASGCRPAASASPTARPWRSISTTRRRRRRPSGAPASRFPCCSARAPAPALPCDLDPAGHV